MPDARTDVAAEIRDRSRVLASRSACSVAASRAHSIAADRLPSSRIRPHAPRPGRASFSAHSIATMPRRRQLVEAEVVHLRALEPVQIDVVAAAAGRRAPSVPVFLDQRERRAADLVRVDPEARGHPADERRLPGAEVARSAARPRPERSAGGEARGDRARSRPRTSRTVRPRSFARPDRGARRSAPAPRRRCAAPGRRPSSTISPSSSAARSPAAPCR